MIITTDLPGNSSLVTKALKCSQGRYENFIHRYFVLWCEVMSDKFHLEDRVLIASESLYNYYKKQWELIVENTFAREIGCYVLEGVEDPTHYTELICGYANGLEKHYPKAIIKQIQK